MPTVSKQGWRLVLLNYRKWGGAGLPAAGDVGVKVLVSPSVNSECKIGIEMFSDNTSSQAYLAFPKMMQKYHRKINTMFLTCCLDISSQHCYITMLYYTMPLPTFWQDIFLGKGSGILQINSISEQTQKKEKQEHLVEKRLAESPNLKIATLLVIRSGRTGSRTQSCAVLLVLFIQLIVLQSNQPNHLL